jgi:hypothetical protein
MRVLQGQGHGLLEQPFSVVKAHNISEPNIGILHKDITLEVGSKLTILGNIGVIGDAFEDSNIEEVVLILLLLEVVGVLN